MVKITLKTYSSGPYQLVHGTRGNSSLLGLIRDTIKCLILKVNFLYLNEDAAFAVAQAVRLI